jgi:sec-independent protein translocase protein TatB
LERFDSTVALLYDAFEGSTATSMLSIPHLIIIFTVALVVFGPEKLPELARNLGKLMAEFRRATGDLRSTFDEHMRDLEREAQLHDLQKREAERARQAAQQPAQLPSPSSELIQQQSPQPTSAEQIPLPGTPQQAELPLSSAAPAVSSPPDTVPHERPNSAAPHDEQ